MTNKNFLKNNLTSNTLKIVYSRNKEYVPPIGMVLLSLLLFVLLILPQVADISQLQNNEGEMKKKIAGLQTKYNFLKNYDDSNLDNQVKIASNALPRQKDYSGIVSAISKSAGNSGISLDDFSFTVGDLTTEPTVSSPPSIQVSFTIKGSIDSTKKFLQSLSKQLPLSEVTSLQISNGVTSLSTIFYYKPFPSLQVSGLEDSPLSPLTQEQSLLLNNLSRLSF